MKTIRIPARNNEASAILGVQNQGLRERLGLSPAFWIVSDEQPAGRSVALLGRREDGEWEVERLHVTLSPGSSRKRTEDAETIARAGSWVYVFGSHFGAKEGPLEPARHFCMRFNEAFVRSGKRLEVKGHLARKPFVLHRLLNDALADSGIELIATEEEAWRDLVEAARKRGEKKHKSWHDLVRPEDFPLNIEGATFLHGGHLLLGLRYPTTKGGHPILVEIEGIDRIFHEDEGEPVVAGIHVLEDIGSERRPAGVRELDSDRSVVHVIVGNLDSDPEESAIVREHPEGVKHQCEHWVVDLGHSRSRVSRPAAERVRRLPEGSVEGLALDGKQVWYALDDEDIVLSVASAGPAKR